MLTHPTLDRMASLGLNGMAAAWRALADQDPGEALNRNEWLGLMLGRKAAWPHGRMAAWRADKRFANRLRNARMRFPNACIEDIDFAAPRGLDRRQILSLAQGGWLKAHEQIILTARPAPARPAPERPGWPAPLPIRPHGWTNPLPMPGCPASLRTWPRRASMAGSRG